MCRKDFTVETQRITVAEESSGSTYRLAARAKYLCRIVIDVGALQKPKVWTGRIS